MKAPIAVKQSRHQSGLVTAQRDIPKNDSGINLTRLTGLGVTGWPCKRGPVDAKTARYIAENTPGGAIIVWEGDSKSHEFAHVYSRTRPYQP